MNNDAVHVRNDNDGCTGTMKACEHVLMLSRIGKAAIWYKVHRSHCS
jgi:hypothetical protein